MATPGGKPPFGYRWHGEDLVISEEEAVVRRRAFELFLEFERKGTVARKLNEEEHCSPGGSKWSDVAVKRTLECRSASGHYAINRTTVRGGKRITLPEEKWDWIACPALVSPEIWQQVQDTLESQRKGSKKTARPPRHLFSGLARCECGEKVRVASGTGKYSCDACGNKISCAELDKMFELELKESLLPVLGKFAEGGDNSQAEEQAKIRAQMANLEELYASKAISLERFSERQRDLSNQEEALPSIHSSQNTSSNPLNPDSDKFLERWPSFPFDQRLKIVQLLVAQIIVCRDDVEFVYRIPDSLKDAPTNQQTPDPTHAPTGGREEQLYIRLPKQGELCPLSGFSRSKLNELILANPRNNHQPPVKSKSTRKKESMRGTRLILRQSLIDYLANLPDG